MKKFFASVLLVASAAFCDWTSVSNIPAHISVETPCALVNGSYMPNFSERIAFISVPGVSGTAIGVSSVKDGDRYQSVLDAALYARRNGKGLGFFLANIPGDNNNGVRDVVVLSGTGTCGLTKSYFVAYGTKD